MMEVQFSHSRKLSFKCTPKADHWRQTQKNSARAIVILKQTSFQMSDWSKLLDKLNSEQLGTNTIFSSHLTCISHRVICQPQYQNYYTQLYHWTVKTRQNPDNKQLLFATRLLATSGYRKALYNSQNHFLASLLATHYSDLHIMQLTMFWRCCYS